MELLGDVVQGSTEDQHLTITPFQKASLEISRYNGEATTELNPLSWWKENFHRYLFYLGWLGNTCVFLQHLFPLKELSVQLVILSVLKDPACNLTQ